jgi:hypothetical protein
LRGALVAGTNGKGSTGAFLASILKAAGHQVGFMPKPHLSSYTERIQVDSEPISEAEFAAAVASLRPQLDGIAAELGEPTEFEILTGLALSYLAPRVDRLVCEVGMGGRLDATNVLDLGVVVVTNVALDHMQYLGDTVEKIAAEKAAVIKPGNSVVTGCRPPALEVVEVAAELLRHRRPQDVGGPADRAEVEALELDSAPLTLADAKPLERVLVLEWKVLLHRDLRGGRAPGDRLVSLIAVRLLEADDQHLGLEAGLARPVRGERRRQDDVPLVAADADDQLETDLLQLDLGLLHEGDRES